MSGVERSSIGSIGVEAAMRRLLPCLRRAGRIAVTLQPLLAHDVQEEKGGTLFASALTAADLLIENQFGADVLQLFSDVGFYGEEFDRDLISSFFPKEADFYITLDPINSTAYFRDGLPQYEVLMSICDRRWRMLGAIAYLPAQDEAYIAYVSRGRPHASVTKFYPRSLEDVTTTSRVLTLTPINSAQSKLVYLDAKYSAQESLVRDWGYMPVFPWRDYRREHASTWVHASHAVLTSQCCGIMNPHAQLIDAGVFGFIARCAGGFWDVGTFDAQTMRYAYGLSAADAKTHELLHEVRERSA